MDSEVDHSHEAIASTIDHPNVIQYSKSQQKVLALITLHILPRWPHLPKKGSTGEGTMQVNSVAPVSYLQIRGGCLHGRTWTIQAPPLCKGPPQFLGLELRAHMGTYLGHYGTSNENLDDRL